MESQISRMKANQHDHSADTLAEHNLFWFPGADILNSKTPTGQQPPFRLQGGADVLLWYGGSSYWGQLVPSKVPDDYSHGGVHYIEMKAEVDGKRKYRGIVEDRVVVRVDRKGRMVEDVRASSHVLSRKEAGSSESQECLRDITEVVLNLCGDDNGQSTPIQEAGPNSAGGHTYGKKVANSPAISLPPASRVFEALLKSNSQRRGHRNKLSSLVHAIGNIIALSVVRTNPKDPNINETSPYLDLSPLYGVTAEDCDALRELDGRGLLAIDCFFEDSLTLTNSAAALLILLNRNHNYIATQLLGKNERGWRSIAAIEDNVEQLKRQDDEIFSLARRINCIYFKNIIVQDFLRSLLGIPYVGTGISLDLLKCVPEGRPIHFHTSVESTVLYNFPSLLSESDAKHLERRITGACARASKQTLVANANARGLQVSKQRKDCAGLRRGLDGQFNDDELAHVLYHGIEQVAGAPTANNVAALLQPWQVQVIEQARSWQVCTLNQYRASLGLKPLESFKEWNSNREVAERAERLYGDINALELYPGLQVEDATPGDGISLGYTWTFGLVIDLMNRIRNDPNFTEKVTPDELTHWGYRECMTSSWNNGSFSAMLPRLLQRLLPRYYTYSSIYSVFPLLVPSKAMSELEGVYKGQTKGFYSYERQPEIHSSKVLLTRQSIEHAFKQPSDFASPYHENLKTLTQGYGFFLGFDNKKLHDADRLLVMYALLPDQGALSRHAAHYSRIFDTVLTGKIEHTKAHSATVDIVEVINHTCAQWVVDNIIGEGAFTNDKTGLELFNSFECLYAFISNSDNQEHRWETRQDAIKTSQTLRDHIMAALPVPHRYDRMLPWWKELYQNVVDWYQKLAQELGANGGRKVAANGHTFLYRIFRYIPHFPLRELTQQVPHLEELRDSLYTKRRLFEGKYKGIDSDVDADFDRERIVSNVLGLVLATSVKVAYAATIITTFYLQNREEVEVRRKEVVALARKEELSNEDKKRLRGYIWEAQRIAQPLVLQRLAKNDVEINEVDDYDGNLNAPFGTLISADLRYDQYDPAIDPARYTPSLYGVGIHKCPAMGTQDKLNIADEILCAIIKSIFRLPNVGLDDASALGTISWSHKPLDSLKLRFVIEQDAHSRGKSKNWIKITKGLDQRPDEVLRYAPLQFVVAVSIAVIGSFLIAKVLFILGSLVYNTAITNAFTVTLPTFRLASILSLLPRGFDTYPHPDAHRATVVFQEYVKCSQPTTQLTPMEFASFGLTTDGVPTSIVYSTNYDKAHRASFIDVDKLDTKFAVLIDGIGRGSSRDFQLDQAKDCGGDYYRCFSEGWSAGMVTVPPGNHTIELRYDGKEFIGATSRVDWGGETTRRFVWWKELCG